MTTGLLIEQPLADQHVHDVQATLALGRNWLSATGRKSWEGRSEDLHEDLCKDSHEDLVKTFLINLEPTPEDH
jgi:hypothetical protein